MAASVRRHTFDGTLSAALPVGTVEHHDDATFWVAGGGPPTASTDSCLQPLFTWGRISELKSPLTTLIAPQA